MYQRNERTKKPILPMVAVVLIALMASMISLSPSVQAKSADIAALERRVAELNRELERAKMDLAAAKEEKDVAQEKAAKAEAELDSRGVPEPAKIKVGPVTVGGAMRVNYVLGSYPGGGSGPSRGGNGGNFELGEGRSSRPGSRDIRRRERGRWFHRFGWAALSRNSLPG